MHPEASTNHAVMVAQRERQLKAPTLLPAGSWSQLGANSFNVSLPGLSVSLSVKWALGQDTNLAKFRLYIWTALSFVVFPKSGASPLPHWQSLVIHRCVVFVAWLLQANSIQNVSMHPSCYCLMPTQVRGGSPSSSNSMDTERVCAAHGGQMRRCQVRV